MILKFSFFYKDSNKDYFLGLLQKVALSHSVEIRVKISEEILHIFANGESKEALSDFANALENEMPLSLYFRLKSVDLCESGANFSSLESPKCANLQHIFTISEINAIKNPQDSRFCDIFNDFAPSIKYNDSQKIDSRESLQNALNNLCDLLSQRREIALLTSKGAISLSTKNNDFSFILANDISSISLYTRASADELNALASFEKPLVNLAIKDIFISEIGANEARFALPYDEILYCISSILLAREMAFLYAKNVESSALNLIYDSPFKSDFFEIIVGQNGYFLHKNFAPKTCQDFESLLKIAFKDSQKKLICYVGLNHDSRFLCDGAEFLRVSFDKNPKNILNKIRALENGEKLINNFAREFPARFSAINALDSTPEMSENILDIFECASMILGAERDKNAILNLAKKYLRDIGPKIDFKNVNSSLGMQFRTCENFGDFADSKSSLNPQNSHKHKSHTANTRILDLKNGESTHDSRESKNPKDSRESQNLSEYKNSKTPPPSPLPQGEGESNDSYGLPPAYFLQAKSKQKNVDLGDLHESCHFEAEAEKSNLLPTFSKSRWGLGRSPAQLKISPSPQGRGQGGGAEFQNNESLHDSRESKSPKDSRHESKRFFAYAQNDKMHDSRESQDKSPRYDELRTIRSIISFTLAGSENEVIAFGIVESLVDYLILMFRQNQFCVKEIAILGDILADKVFFSKITKKFPKDLDLVFPKYLDF